tara:strand:- start:362 stop:583 length:222 start_codon:yes stop_codon:yes gene_type:complete
MKNDLINLNNYYEYEESNDIYEPMVQPFSYFYVGIAGQIEFGEFIGLDGLQIKYAFVVGDDWQLAHGHESNTG